MIKKWAGIKKLLHFFLIIFLLSNYSLLPQSNYNKVGGINFRVDDSYPIPNNRLIPFINIFNMNKLKFTYAVNFGIDYITPELISTVRQMQAQGFEIGDHTPNHDTRYFDVPFSDRAIYQGQSYVDHIIYNFNNELDRDRICLKFDHVDVNTITGEGTININGDTVTCNTPGEFTTLKVSDLQEYNRMNFIYIPAPTNKLFTFDHGDVKGDTIYNLKTFWDENVNLALNNIQYHIMGRYDVFYSPEAIRALSQRTQKMCDQESIAYPKVWVQPGGYFPQFYRADIKAALESMGYFTAGVFADPVPPYYNSYDPNDDNRFGMNWGDFQETQSLTKWKYIIADRFARHFVSIGSSHLLIGYSDSFSEYLQKTDDILKWCLNKGIPVKTYREWAELLDRTPQYANINVMPNVDIDLDEDGQPDGFYNGTYYSNGITIDGKPNAFIKSFIKNGNGRICYVDQLGGVEKGDNYFGIWIKGIGSIKVILNTGSQQPSYTFTSNSTDWNYYHCTFQIPPTTSALTYVDIWSQNTTGNIQVGGFELRKNYSNQINPPFLYMPTISNNSIPLVWLDNSSNETGFSVRRMFEHENIWETIKDNLTPDSTTWIDNLLDFPDSLKFYSSIKVYYEIQANSGSSISTLSNTQIIIIPTAPLPVELSSFKAKYNNNKVQLSWRTETEVNNYGFDVERKVISGQSQVDNSNGKGWAKIGFVNGNGNSNTPKEYSYLDKNPIGESKIQYRLKQIDNDGKYEYSDVVEVEIVPTEFALYQNYPNPFNPATKIRYQLPEKSRVYLKVFNSLGQEVATLLDDTKEPGNYEVDFNGSNLSSGVYYYRMQAGNFISTKKMIILK